MRSEGIQIVCMLSLMSSSAQDLVQPFTFEKIQGRNNPCPIEYSEYDCRPIKVDERQLRLAGTFRLPTGADLTPFPDNQTFPVKNITFRPYFDGYGGFGLFGLSDENKNEFIGKYHTQDKTYVITKEEGTGKFLWLIMDDLPSDEEVDEEPVENATLADAAIDEGSSTILGRQLLVDPGPVNISIQFYTTRYKNGYRGNSVITKLKLLVAEFNQIMKYNDVGIQINHACWLPATKIRNSTGISTSDMLKKFANIGTKDEIMKTADIAILMADNDLNGSGIAPSYGLRFNKMWAVATWSSAFKQMTLVHEIAHLLGCKHDRLQESTLKTGYGFGYHVDFPLFTKITTIMAYPRVTYRSSKRLPFFSSDQTIPYIWYNGKTYQAMLGNAKNNNRRILIRNKVAASKYGDETNLCHIIM